MTVSCTTTEPADTNTPKDDTSEVVSTQNDTEQDPEPEPEPEPQPDNVPPMLQNRFLSHYEWSEDEAKLLTSIDYSIVTLADTSKELYPELDKALTQRADNWKLNFDVETEELGNNAKQEYAAVGEEFETYVSTVDVQVRRCDDVVVSLLTDSLADYYQIEDCRRFHGTNLDTETGVEISLTDVVKDLDELPALIEEAMAASSWAGVLQDETYIDEYFTNMAVVDISWTLDYNGITFHFSPGDIADEFYGNINALISFADHPELFNEKYSAVPDSYGARLNVGHPYFYDLNGDGDTEELLITGLYDEENDFYNGVDLYVDDNLLSEELFAYDYIPYLIKTAEDSYYLYLFCQGDASSELFVYSLDEDIEAVGDMMASCHCEDDSYSIITDPDSMLLDTVDGPGEFYVGDDGMPALKK